MEENASQILSIVQGTFPGLNFETFVKPTYCSSPQSDGEVLSCLWFEATRGRRGQDLVIGDQSLSALQEVCISSQVAKACADRGKVLQVCTRGHEQYSQQLQPQKSLHWHWHCYGCYRLFYDRSLYIVRQGRCNWDLDSTSGNFIRSDDVCKQFR